MLDHRSILETQEQPAVNLLTTEKNPADFNNQKSNDESPMEEEASSQEFFQIELNSEEPESDSETGPCSEQENYLWKTGGVMGSFFSTSLYCLGYVVERDVVKMQTAQSLAIPSAASILAPAIVGVFAYSLPSHLNFKTVCQSFILSGVATGVVDSLASLFFPNAPYAPASLLIPSLTAMTILNIATPEACISIPAACHKITKLTNKLTDNCFSLFSSKSNNPSQVNDVNEANLNEKSLLISQKKM